MSSNTVMFPGSGDVYVQYHDILGIPMFHLLRAMIYGEIASGLFDFGVLRRFSSIQLIEWYLLRPKFNFLQIEPFNIHHFTDDQTDKLMHQFVQEMPYDTFSPVNLVNAFFLHPIVERLHVYTRYQEPKVNGILKKMKRNVQSADYRFGTFDTIIRDAREHATLITTSTSEAKAFLQSKHSNRYVSLIFPNQYDPIQNVSDIYSKYADQFTIIDVRDRVPLWKEYVE